MQPPPVFVPGRDLAASLYEEVVGPALRDITHDAALLGGGSDVLGLDDARSTDHGWGPRMSVFVDSADVESTLSAVDAALPPLHRGWPVRFGSDKVEVRHHVEVTTLAAWLDAHLGFDPRAGVTVLDWLATPQQLLLEVTAGAVLFDPRGTLGALRTALCWYPDDVWRYALAAQWQRIAQEEAFVGRTAEVGDDLGSRIVAARLARDAMRLCFVLERRYAPYTKWLGTAFQHLAAASDVGPHLAAALKAETGQQRERALVAAFGHCIARQNALGLVDAVDEVPRAFHGRPFLVIGADRCAAACKRGIVDPALRDRALAGTIDQQIDSTDVLATAAAARRAFGG